MLREARVIISDSIEDFALERKYTKFMRFQREERLVSELENLKRQRDMLILKINIHRESGGSEQVVAILKELQKMETERIEKVEEEN